MEQRTLLSHALPTSSGAAHHPAPHETAAFQLVGSQPELAHLAERRVSVGQRGAEKHSESNAAGKPPAKVAVISKQAVRADSDTSSGSGSGDGSGSGSDGCGSDGCGSDRCGSDGCGSDPLGSNYGSDYGSGSNSSGYESGSGSGSDYGSGSTMSSTTMTGATFDNNTSTTNNSDGKNSWAVNISTATGVDPTNLNIASVTLNGVPLTGTGGFGIQPGGDNAKGQFTATLNGPSPAPATGTYVITLGSSNSSGPGPILTVKYG